MDIRSDRRIVLTLDAGGTSFRFSAMCGCEPVTDTVCIPSNGDDLDKCLTNIVEGATRQIAIPGGRKTIAYDPLPRTGVGISRLGTSEAVGIGAYAYALHKLNQLYGTR